MIKNIVCVLIFLSLFFIQTELLFGGNRALVLLHGTSSAGKSSICEKIKTLESAWHVISLDDIYTYMVVELTSLYFPKEFAILAKVVPPQNFYHAIKRNEIQLDGEAFEALSNIHLALSLPTAVQSFQNTLWRQLEVALKKEIQTAFQEGKDVLIDSRLPQEITENYFKENQVIHVLVYTPFPISFEFLQKRNEDALHAGNLYKKRFLGQLITDFSKYYCLTTEKSERIIEELNLSDLESTFDKASSLVLQNWDEKESGLFIQSEMNLFELQKTKNALIPSKEQQILFIEPKERYDLLLSTRNKQPEELAASLLEQLNHLVLK